MTREEKKNFEITITDTATYIIKAYSEEEAIECAMEYFEERTPSFRCVVTNENAEVEI